MIKLQVTPDEVISFLNHILEIDSQALQDLINARVLCNDKLAEHPTVQVSGAQSIVNPNTVEYGIMQYRVGVLGLLNGIFGIIDEGEHKGFGAIVAEYDGDKLVNFRRIK